MPAPPALKALARNSLASRAALRVAGAERRAGALPLSAPLGAGVGAAAGLSAHRVGELLLMMGDHLDHAVDITATFDRKLRAVRAHGTHMAAQLTLSRAAGGGGRNVGAESAAARLSMEEAGFAACARTPAPESDEPFAPLTALGKRAAASAAATDGLPMGGASI